MNRLAQIFQRIFPKTSHSLWFAGYTEGVRVGRQAASNQARGVPQLYSGEIITLAEPRKGSQLGIGSGNA